jgi:hypothetical protein
MDIRDLDPRDVEPSDYAKAVQEDRNDRIKKATALMLMKNTEGWAILLSTFEDMKQKQLSVLAAVNPGDEKTILAAHAVWYSVVHALEEVVRAVDLAILDGIEAQRTSEGEFPSDKDEENWS